MSDDHKRNVLTREEIENYVKLAAKGDLDAFDVLMSLYQKPIYFTCLKVLNQQAEADELCQQTFVKAFRLLKQFRFESQFKTWLMSIALNLCRNELRKKHRDFEELTPSLSDGSFEKREETEESSERTFNLKKALDQLPLKQKEVVLLRVNEEMSFKEIAEATGSSVNSSKVNFHHALKFLKEHFERRKAHGDL